MAGGERVLPPAWALGAEGAVGLPREASSESQDPPCFLGRFASKQRLFIKMKVPRRGPTGAGVLQGLRGMALGRFGGLRPGGLLSEEDQHLG